MIEKYFNYVDRLPILNNNFMPNNKFKNENANDIIIYKMFELSVAIRI